MNMSAFGPKIWAVVWLLGMVGAEDGNKTHGCIVVQSGRVGSHFLMHLLRQHPEVWADGELLKESRQEECEDCGPNGTIEGVFKYLDDNRNESVTVFKSGGGGSTVTIDDFMTYDCRLIFLWRTDYLGVFISQLTGRLYNVYTTNNATNLTDDYKLHVDPEEYYRQADNYERMTAHVMSKLSKRKEPGIAIEYNALNAKPETEMSKVFHLFGLDEVEIDLEAIPQKVHKRSTLDYVENRDELCDYLKAKCAENHLPRDPCEQVKNC